MAQLRSRIDTGEGDQREPEALEIKQLVNPQRSSGGEHCLHTAGVTGSIPVAPTIYFLYTTTIYVVFVAIGKFDDIPGVTRL